MWKSGPSGPRKASGTEGFGPRRGRLQKLSARDGRERRHNQARSQMELRQIRELVYARKDYLVRRTKSQANRIFSGGKDRKAIAKRKPTTSDFETRNSKLLLLILPLFKHVLDGRFIDHHIRFAAIAVHLDAVPVIPLNDAVNLFPVSQHDHHLRARLHLLLIVEILRVRLLRRRRLLSAARSHRTLSAVSSLRSVMPFRTISPFLYRHRRTVMIAVILGARQRRANQLTVREVFPVSRFSGRHRSHKYVLHRGASSGTRVRAS